jgi:hypothetical protein
LVSDISGPLPFTTGWSLEQKEKENPPPQKKKIFSRKCLNLGCYNSLMVLFVFIHMFLLLIVRRINPILS